MPVSKGLLDDNEKALCATSSRLRKRTVSPLLTTRRAVVNALPFCTTTCSSAHASGEAMPISTIATAAAPRRALALRSRPVSTRQVGHVIHAARCGQRAHEVDQIGLFALA